MRSLPIKIGDRFGKLEVIAGPFRERRGKWTHRVFEVKCDCGTIERIRASVLWLNRVVSCGCWPGKMNAADRFFSKIQQGDNGCLIWTGAIGAYGYGDIKINGRSLRAHRVAYELAGNVIPDGLCVCHHCDNRRCVNPEHLFVGTHKDNAADRDNKNRQVKGERQHSAKLTPIQIIDIRNQHAAGKSQRALAREFGMDKSTIGDIVKRRIWRHV